MEAETQFIFHLGNLVKRELDRTGKVSTEVTLPATLWYALKKEGYLAAVNPDDLCKSLHNIETEHGFTELPSWRKFSLIESGGNHYGRYYCIARLFFEGKVYRGKDSAMEPVDAMLLAYNQAITSFGAGFRAELI